MSQLGTGAFWDTRREHPISHNVPKCTCPQLGHHVPECACPNWINRLKSQLFTIEKTNSGATPNHHIILVMPRRVFIIIAQCPCNRRVPQGLGGCRGRVMLEFDLARSFPSIAIGFVVGVLAFAPLLAAVLPVLRRTRDADMTLGFIGIFASFAVLLVGVLAAYVLARAVCRGRTRRVLPGDARAFALGDPQGERLAGSGSTGR